MSQTPMSQTKIAAKERRVRALIGTRKGVFAADAFDPAGLYFGTETGQLFHSSNEGKVWSLLADFLPPILSVEVAVV